MGVSDRGMEWFESVWWSVCLFVFEGFVYFDESGLNFDVHHDSDLQTATRFLKFSLLLLLS